MEKITDLPLLHLQVSRHVSDFEVSNVVITVQAETSAVAKANMSWLLEQVKLAGGRL